MYDEEYGGYFDKSTEGEMNDDCAEIYVKQRPFLRDEYEYLGEYFETTLGSAEYYDGEKIKEALNIPEEYFEIYAGTLVQGYNGTKHELQIVVGICVKRKPSEKATPRQIARALYAYVSQNPYVINIDSPLLLE